MKVLFVDRSVTDFTLVEHIVRWTGALVVLYRMAENQVGHVPLTWYDRTNDATNWIWLQQLPVRYQFFAYNPSLFAAEDMIDHLNGVPSTQSVYGK